MEDLLELLPVTWLPYLFAFCVGSSVLSALIKRVLGDPTPSDSGQRRAWFELAKLLDYAALNSETVKSKLKRMRAELAARDEAEIAEAQRNPSTLTTAIDHYNLVSLLQDAESNAESRLEAGAPPDVVEADRFRREMALRSMTPERRRIERAELVAMLSKVGRGARVLGLVVLLSGSLTACAGSHLKTHATIADAAYAPLLVTKRAIEMHMAADAKLVRDRVSDADAERAEMAALQDSYAHVETSFTLLSESYNAYVDAIQQANATGADVPHEFALALLSRWQAFVDVARTMGLTVPEPPDALRNLGGGS